MKKSITLIIALFFAAGAAFAQSNEATVTLNGDDNSSTVDQFGSNNIGTVNASGDRQTSVIGQGVDGMAIGADATIRQGGSDNIATSSQGLDGGSSFNDGVFIRQSSGSENTALVEQGIGVVSSNNRAFVSQEGSFDDATVSQGGDNQFVRILQGARGISNGNSATLIQEEGGAGNVAYIDQGTAFGGGSATAFDNTTEVTQSGVWNVIGVQQGSAFGGSASATDGNIIATQTGVSNYLNIAQTGVGNDVTFEQSGNFNRSRLLQSDGSSASILQNGDNNAIVGIGTDLSGTLLLDAISSGGSTLTVDQMGDGNTLFLDQTNGATATVTQDGMTNTSTIIQN